MLIITIALDDWRRRRAAPGARDPRFHGHCVQAISNQEGERMLKITIELVPGGFEPMRRTIASMRISNESNLSDFSNYHVSAMEDANPLTGDPPRNTTCSVLSHNRRQSVWAFWRERRRRPLRRVSRILGSQIFDNESDDHS
jgi:hypothetical protein